MPSNFRSQSCNYSSKRTSRASKMLEEDEVVLLYELIDNNKKHCKRRRTEVKKEIQQEILHEKRSEKSPQFKETTDIKGVRTENLKFKKQDFMRGGVKEEDMEIGSCKTPNDKTPIPFNLFTQTNKGCSVEDEIYGSPPPLFCLSDLSTLVDKDDIADQDTLQGYLEKKEDDLVLACDDSDVAEEVKASPAKRAHKKNDSIQARKPELADKGIQAELPTSELTNLKELVDKQNGLLAKRNQEIEDLKENVRFKDTDYQHLLAEKDKKIENLNINFMQKLQSQETSIQEKVQEIENLKEILRQNYVDHERLVTDKTQKIESLRETLIRKEIALVAATSLLGLSLEESVRKSAEVQIAKDALAQQLVTATNARVQLPTVSQIICSCATEKADNSEERNSTPINLSSKRDTSDVNNSQPAPSSTTAGTPCKDEYSRRDRPSVNGVYVDAFPLQPDILKAFASSSNASAFVRAVMLHCFTNEYLKTKSISQLDESHVDEITDAVMTNFTYYRTKKDSAAQNLNRPTVRTFISNVLTAQKKKAQNRSRKL